MSKFSIGERVLIVDGFYSTEKASKLAENNSHKDWVPTGTIKKNPSKNDKISYNNGDEWEILDNYNVELFINPHKKTNETVLITYLDEDNIVKINVDD